MPTQPSVTTPTKPNLPPKGSLQELSCQSPVLGGALHYTVYLPACYATSSSRYSVLFLLHGRGGSMRSWKDIGPALDALIAEGAIPPLVAILPDIPASQRASYYVDSEYENAEHPGARIETAFCSELLPHLESHFRLHTDRTGRVLGGYSMGGYGALRYALTYPELFASALVLSPAVYTPLPPTDSSTRLFGAFGRGSEPFVDQIYKRLNYPELLKRFPARRLSLRLFIAAGENEYKHPDPADQLHDITTEARLLFERSRRTPGISARLRVLPGGHGWEVWTPALDEGLRFVRPSIRPPE